MKKGWKIFIITCAAVFGIGVVFCIAGFAVGVSDQEVRNAFGKGFGRIGRLGIFHNYAISEYEENTEMEVNPIDEDAERIFSDIRNLEIDVSCLNIEIRTTNGDYLRVEEEHTDSECDYSIYEEEGTLVIRAEHEEHHRHKNYGTVILYVPEKQKFEEVDCSVGAGVLEIEKLSAGEAEFEVGAGSVVLHELEADREIAITCGMGSVEMTMSGEKEDYNYELEVGMGTVSIGGSEFGGMAIEKTIENSAPKNMDIECGMGSVEIYF